MVNRAFHPIYEQVNVLLNSDAAGLILEGSAGLGKSYHAIKAVEGGNRGGRLIVGYLTPLRLYETLYKFNGRVLIYDDCDSILRDNTSINILKNALYSHTGRRLLGYSSSTPLLNAPSCFEFTGKVIIIVNKLPKDLEAISSRVLYLRHEIPDTERFNVLMEVGRELLPDYGEGELKTLVEGIIKDKGDLRDLIKARWSKQALTHLIYL